MAHREDRRDLQKALTALLREASFRPTIPRLEILEALSGIGQPVQIQDLFLALVEQGSAMTISTCYRCMAEFEKKGLVARDWLASGRVVYWLKGVQSAKPAAHRMVCRTCHRGFDVDALLGAQLDEQLRRTAQAHGLNPPGEAMTILVQCGCTPNTENNLKAQNAPVIWPKRVIHRFNGRS